MGRFEILFRSFFLDDERALCHTPLTSTTTKKKRPTDVNLLALSIIKDAMEEPTPTDLPQQSEKNPAAVALGRLGGIKGGNISAEKLTS